MTYEELEKHVMYFFGDTDSRKASETKSDLMSLAQKCEELADTIEDDEDD